jgi:subtilisin
LDWLVTESFDDRAAWVVNISLGHPGYDAYLYERIRDMSELFGMLAVAAIGNEAALQPDAHSSPANYDIVIGVGATDQSDNVWTDSGRGTVKEHGAIEKPDLCAPGVEIRSCVPGSNYDLKSGSSMATSIVSGAAMLLVQADLSLRGSPKTLTERLYGLVKPFPGKKGMGRGRIDLSAI